MDAAEVLKMVWPLIIVQIALQIYALVDLFKRKKVKNLSLPVWAVIIILGEIVGPILYLLIGREE